MAHYLIECGKVKVSLLLVFSSFLEPPFVHV